MEPRIVDRKFVCYFHFVSWWDISFGVSIDLVSPHLDIHLPFGFIRVGWSGIWLERMTDHVRSYGWDYE